MQVAGGRNKASKGRDHALCCVLRDYRFHGWMSHFVSPFNLVSTVFKSQQPQLNNRVTVRECLTWQWGKWIKNNISLQFLFSSAPLSPSLYHNKTEERQNLLFISHIFSSDDPGPCSDDLPQFYWSLKNISESEHSKLFECGECSGEWVCPRLGDDWLWAEPRSEDIVRMHGTDTVHTQDQRLSSQQITLRWSLHHLRNLNYNFAGNFILV